MKGILLLSLMLVAYCTLGQSLEDLDKNRGSKDFRVGDTISLHRHKIKYIKKLEGHKTRLYRVKDNLVINGLEGYIELAFYKKRVAEVVIYFEEASGDSFDLLKKTLTGQYGTPTNGSLSKERTDYYAKFDKIYSWKGSSIGLLLVHDSVKKIAEIIYWDLKETTIEEF